MTDQTALDTLRQNLRQWLAANKPQGWRDISQHQVFAESQRAWFLKLVEAGYAVPHWPSEWPGGGRSLAEQKVIYEELAAADRPAQPGRWPVIYLSPRGKPFDQATARRLAGCEGITLLCGRFEGVDQRVLDHHGVEEISLGDFVLTGGEIAATALIDATVRLIRGVLGNQQSTEEESFSEGLLEFPHYTRPTVWQGREIPEVLQSGHHANIATWRKAMAERLTKERRPDLWRAYCAAHGRDPNEDRER